MNTPHLALDTLRAAKAKEEGLHIGFRGHLFDKCRLSNNNGYGISDRIMQNHKHYSANTIYVSKKQSQISKKNKKTKIQNPWNSRVFHIVSTGFPRFHGSTVCGAHPTIF
jgi:hypothetical protein